MAREISSARNDNAPREREGKTKEERSEEDRTMLIDLDPPFRSAFGLKSSHERIDKCRVDRTREKEGERETAVQTDESKPSAAGDASK